MRIKTVIFVLFFLGTGLNTWSQKTRINFHPTKVWVKVESASQVDMAEILRASRISFESVQHPFPATEKRVLRGGQEVDISLWYELEFKSPEEVGFGVESLKDLPQIEFVERKKIQTLSLVVNDPDLGKQVYLNQVLAPLAWDITTGSSSVVVGIIDSGTDLDHPDLVTNLYENVGDPINGQDDDNDGYIDNFNGWDFMDNDHLPEAQTSSHGIQVSGIAAATTNNNIGVASVGFQTKYMPIRVADGTDVEFGYEGIVYAAEMGCDIINCSWGSYGYSKFEEDIINYATFNHNALVVCAAGNAGVEQVYYPAGYENALAVASVNSTDKRSSFTNYGYWVDITAPGENIHTTYKDGGYNSNTGTSMSAPVVAGAAALVKARYPALSGMQIGERLKQTSDLIDNLNPGFEHKIGRGRLNAFEAVNGTINNASVVFWDQNLTNGKNQTFVSGDTIKLSGTFTNYLGVSGNVTATAQSSSMFLSGINTVDNLGIFQPLESKNNNGSPFLFVLDSASPENSIHVIEVEVTDGGFTNVYFVEVHVNVDYLNIDVNKINATITSKGVIGYNDNFQAQGIGITYDKGTSQLYECGIMIGTQEGASYKVVDRIRNSGSSWDADLSPVENVKYQTVPDSGDQMLVGIFDDSTAITDSIGLWVKHESFGYKKVGHENYFVNQYYIVNNSGKGIDNLSVGLFADFDIDNYEENRMETLENKFIGYSYSVTSSAPYFGVQLLNSKHFRSYGIDNVPGGNGGISINDGYPSSEKLATMRNNRLSAGYALPEGNDVAQVISSTNINILSGDTVKVAFAIHAASSLEEIVNSADSAYFQYNGFLPTSLNEIEIGQLEIFPNPSSESVFIQFPEGRNSHYNVKIWDISGKMIFQKTAFDPIERVNVSSWFSGVYFIEARGNGLILRQKFVKID